MIIDATNLILGRLAAKAAKLALNGEEVKIINCEKVVVVGKKSEVLARYKRKVEMGVPRKGPFLHRGADRIVRRTIRGMLPYKEENGKQAFERVMCYIENPENLKGETIDSINIDNTQNTNYITVKEISQKLGYKY